MLDAFEPEFFPDTVVIYPIQTTQGVRGGEIPILSDGVEMLTGIQRGVPSGLNTLADNSDTLHRAGLTHWNLIFASDPNILAAGQTIRWTKHNGIAKNPVYELTTLGAAEPPGGLVVRWTVACYSRS